MKTRSNKNIQSTSKKELKRKLVSHSNNNGQNEKRTAKNPMLKSSNPTKLIQTRPKRTITKVSENVSRLLDDIQNTSIKDLKRKLVSDSNNNGQNEKRTSNVPLLKCSNPTKIVRDRPKRTIAKLSENESRVLDDIQNTSIKDLKRKLVSDSNNNGQNEKQTAKNPLSKSSNPTKLVQTRPKRTIAKLRENVSRVLDDTQNTSIKDLKRKLVLDSNKNRQNEKQTAKSPLLKSSNPTKLVQTRPKRTIAKVNENMSRVLDDRKKSPKQNRSNLDVYEFTYDPSEEPPIKKKKKKAVKRNPGKPKTATYKSNYDKNLAKAMAALKKTVAAKSSQKKKETQADDNENSLCQETQKYEEQMLQLKPLASDSIYTNAHHSVRVEDIALQFQEDNHDINYSPITSPIHQTSPVHQDSSIHQDTPVHQDIVDKTPLPLPTHNDPLNLNQDLSFFDDPPAASSSMNTSKHPLASPWRVEFNNLPIEWTINSYMKANMTPSVETSFINFNEGKKKHVYTNIAPEEDEVLPVVQETTPNLKQTSILSFIKEMVEKNAKKKKRIAESTPVKNNSLNDSLSPLKEVTPERIENHNIYNVKRKQNIGTQSTEKNVAAKCKDSAKKKNRNQTYFGFDDSENQENVSPKKNNPKAKSLRLKSRAILKEIHNVQNSGKVVTPLTAKTGTLAIASKVFDVMKSGTEPPLFPEVDIEGNTNIIETCELEMPRNIENDDSQSIHLFEDIKFVHHLKPNRKSYSKNKKVTFNKNLDVDNNSDVESEHHSSDDMDEESFRIPYVKRKKINKKKKVKPKLSKKEEQEVEAWAAGFNSMCEDVEEFNLVVE